MSKTVRILSTLSSDHWFGGHKVVKGEKAGELNVLEIPTGKVLLRGGANVAKTGILTPDGILHEVSEDEYAVMQTDPKFGRMQKRGFIKVLGNVKDKEKVLGDMEPKDGSAMLTDTDLHSDDPDGELTVQAGKTVVAKDGNGGTRKGKGGRKRISTAE